MNEDEYYMELAFEESIKAYQKGEVPVGAIIVYEDKIIGKGHNLKEQSNDITMHAEIIAIKKASNKLNDWRLINSVMYVTLFPCPMCASAIVQSRISRLVVGVPTLDLKTKKIVLQILEGNKTSSSVLLNENVLTDKCKKVLVNFFKEKRK